MVQFRLLRVHRSSVAENVLTGIDRVYPMPRGANLTMVVLSRDSE